MCARQRESRRRCMVERSLTADGALPVAVRRDQPRKTLDLRYQPGFGTVAVICLMLLYAPILVMTIFSFNGGLYVTRWGGFGLNWYGTALRSEGFHHAALNTMKIAITATVVSTMVATAAALATTRTARWRGQMTSFIVINLPLMVPEIITAVASLPAGDPAAPHARHQRGCGARLHHILRRFYHHATRGRPGTDHAAAFHLGSHAHPADPRDQLHEHDSVGRFDRLCDSIVSNCAPEARLEVQVIQEPKTRERNHEMATIGAGGSGRGATVRRLGNGGG